MRQDAIRDADRKREERLTKKLVIIPPCADPDRRTRFEADDEAWLRFYFGLDSETPDPFTYAFTAQQREIIRNFGSVLKFGGDQAIAASRGEGKTTILERLLLKYTLQGSLQYSVFFAATGALADNSLDTIKSAIELNALLFLDYPEVCVPVRALENTPNRAHYQIVSGNRHDNGQPYDRHPDRFSWCGQEIILPFVPGSPSSGAIVAARGLDAAVRGLKKRGHRPQLAAIDDPETEDSQRNPEQARKLEERIDRSIGGLGGQQKAIARLMVTTIPNRTCVSHKFTDPAQKPTWKGKRFRYLQTKPERLDLWEEFVQLRSTQLQSFALGLSDDEHCRKAHEFYLENRASMDAGAEVANPNRFNSSLLPDGSQSESSALEHYYNEVARLGADAVATEYDNDPPEETGPVESGITPHRIQKQVNGYKRKEVPPDCVKITRGIDCRKVALHYVVRGWRSDGTPFTLDYGVWEVFGTTFGSDEGLDVALKRALLSYLDASRWQYATADGTPRAIDRTLIDAGWRTEAVYAACVEAGVGVSPVMGFGKSAGCTQANFSEVQKKTTERRPGDGWFLSQKRVSDKPLWLVCADADRWKAWEHDRWLTPQGRPGCMTLFGAPSDEGGRLSDDEKAHFSYARHICNEIEIEEPHKGTLRRRWKAKSENTHWLDASYYSDVAANMEGIRVLLPASLQPGARPAKKRKRVSYL